MVTKKDIKGIIVIILFFLFVLFLKKQYQNYIETYHIENIHEKIKEI